MAGALMVMVVSTHNIFLGGSGRLMQNMSTSCIFWSINELQESDATS